MGINILAEGRQKKQKKWWCMSRLLLYQHLDTIKVDTSVKTVLEIAREIMEISKER